MSLFHRKTIFFHVTIVFDLSSCLVALKIAFIRGTYLISEGNMKVTLTLATINNVYGKCFGSSPSRMILRHINANAADKYQG